MSRKRRTKRKHNKRRPFDFPDTDHVKAEQRRQINARLKPRLYRLAWEASKVHKMKLTDRVRYLLSLDAKACLGPRVESLLEGIGLSPDNPCPPSQ